MEFTCKAWYVASGHLTDPPDNFLAHASVVSRELVLILFLVAALYDIKVLAAGISNAFLNAPCAKKFQGRARI